MRRTVLSAGWAVLALAMAMPALGGDVEFRDDQKPGTPEQVELGKSQFAMCAGCHGAEGEGRVGIAPRLNSGSYLAVVGNDFLKRTIMEGRTGTNMAPFGASMQPEQVDGLVAFIRNWQTKPGIEINNAELDGDLAVGEKMWNNICARCHGRSGAGYSEAGSGTGIGRKGFLDQATDGMLRAVIKYGKDNTAMRPFDSKSPVAVANLTDREIDSVILYLRQNAW